MNSQIEDLFLEIETLIKLQLKDNIQNNSEVEQKFKDAITLINEIEADDEKQHGLYRYKYHSTYNSYLKTVGDMKNADKQEKLAKRFEKYSNTHAERPTQYILFTDVTTPNTVNQDRDCTLKNKKIAEQLENIYPILLEELTETNLGDKFINEIKQIFEKLNEATKTFEGYLETVNCEIYLRKLADNLINEKLIILEASQILTNSNDKEEFDNKPSKLENISTGLIDHLKSLKFLAHEIAYSKRIEFISFFSNSSNKMGILFKNVINTEEEINRRARIIGSCFHPDRTKNPKCPFWLKGIYKSQGDELFKLISEFKDHLLNNLNQSSEPEYKIDDCEKYGHDLWKLTIDYHNASKGEWSKLKVLKKDEINELSPEALKYNSMYMGELAYHQYRAACKVADKAKLLKKQVKLRGYMALCLYFTNKFLEAPLYALAAIHLQIQNSHNVTQQELNEAKQLFDKVNGRKEMNKKEECTTSNSNIEVKLESDFNNVMALVKIKDQEISFNHRKIIQNSINKDLNNMATKLFIEADRSLVCYQTSCKEILSAKKHATSHKVKGGATIASGVIGGGVVVSTALGNICEATFEFGFRSLAAPAFLVVGAFVIVAAGIYSGLGMYKKGAKMLKEPKIREKLNKIMTKALSSYDKGEYQEFINALSEEYDEKSHKSLIECCDGIGIKGTDDIVSTLKMHGFRSDGIAYLLVLLGEVLGSGKIIIEGITHADLKTHAKRIFREALNNDLVEEARKLDKCTSELRKTSKGDYTRFFKSTYGKVLDSIFSRENTNLALEYLDDSLEMPFFSRLEEIRNIARINIAILNITEYDLYACREAIKIVDEVRKSIRENYQFISKAQLRLEILEDFLWIISGEVLPDTSFITSSVTTESALELNDKYINYLNNQLSFNQEKTHKYDKAVYFEHLAEKEAKINKLTSLRYWQCAQENYESLREIDPEESTYSLGYARCLLKLSKYTQVIGLSDTCPVLNPLSEYWHFRSIAYFKQAKYKESMVCNTEALTIDPKNNPADEHRELINKLKVENTVKHHIDRYKSELIYETDYLKNSHSNERPVYNILSIDGGGIRGVLPALWLSEIEYRTHRPISHLFNMIAGTSTGGIIAAGLSAPQFEEFESNPNEVSNDQIFAKTYRYEYSDLKPRLSASELLNIYKDDAKTLFSKRSWTFFNISDQYTNEGRSTMFKKYFEETKLSHSLTELVIPAVNETYSPVSHLFTRYDACKNSEDDNTLVDTLMATTAAPTFFPPYNIWNKGTFLDGGIHLNNPALTAYGEAIRYKVASEKISVLSLGTGCYIPDPSKPELYRHLLFWAQNLPNLTMSAQEGNTDREMYNILGNRYQRWQIFFEEPMGLDNHESIPNLLELGCQYIEELDYSDENPINTLVESFEHKYFI